MIKEILMKYPILTLDYLEKNKDDIFRIIPELKDEENFDQKSSWHIYDVWKHTEVALTNSNMDFEERMALLLHDIGKPHCFQEDGEIRHFKGHAQKSAEISKDILKRLLSDERQINRIIFLIENHSTVINMDNVNEGNMSLYRKLLNIQYCDTKAYNPEKTEKVFKRLDEINGKLSKMEKEKNDIREI